MKFPGKENQQRNNKIIILNVLTMFNMALVFMVFKQTNKNNNSPNAKTML